MQIWLPAEIAVPSLLLVLLGFSIWLSVFAGTETETVPYLKSRSEDQISGVAAAIAAIDDARNIVPNRSDGDDGLLKGPPDSVLVRYEPLGSASSWTVVIRGPIRIRPNTNEEFAIDDGEIVVEISAFSGDVSGNFSAGRAFGAVTGIPAGLQNSPGGGAVLSALGMSPEGLIDVPRHLVWPPE